MDPLDSLAEDLSKSTSSPSPSQSSQSSEPTPAEEPGSSQGESSKTGSSTSEASQTEAPIDDAPPIGEEDFGDSDVPAQGLPFKQESTRRITKSEDAKFAEAIDAVKERMFKVQDEGLVATFIARTCGVYGAEHPSEIRSRLDRERFWHDLSQMCEQWELMKKSRSRVADDD